MIAATDRNPERLDCTLTDGYAQALALEAERRRLERRLTEMAQSLRPGDPAEKTIELSDGRPAARRPRRRARRPARAARRAAAPRARR